MVEENKDSVCVGDKGGTHKLLGRTPACSSPGLLSCSLSYN